MILLAILPLTTALPFGGRSSGINAETGEAAPSTDDKRPAGGWP